MLKRFYATEADVPEDVKHLYAEKDGKWVLQAEPEEPAGNNRQVLADLARERKKRQELEAKVARWEAIGKTEEEIQALLAAEEERGNKDALDKGEWDKLKAQMVEKHEKEMKRLRDQLADKDKTIAARDTTIEQMLVDTSATAAIAAAEGNPKLLMPFVKSQIKVVHEDGKTRLEIVDAKGDPRVNVKGEPLSVAELVAEMRQNEEYGGLFKGAGQSGSGTPPGGGNGGGNGKVPPGTRKSGFKTERERAEFVDAHGTDVYRALPD
jgi:hypothetical protein